MPRPGLTLPALVASAAALTLAACGGDEESATAAPLPAAAPVTATTTAAARPRGITVTTRRSRFGRVLFSGSGRVFYLFTKEQSSRARCYGACAKAWPPVLTKGEPRARGAARQSLIGTTTRRDGSRQVTYAGRPMYYYVGDGTGQILCHNVIEFGGTWLVVKPNGQAA